MKMRMVMVRSLLCLAAILALSQVSQAVMVTKIQVVAEQTLGVNSDYTDGTVEWSGGVFGIIFFDVGDPVVFSTGTGVVAGVVKGAVEQSTGTLASAVFSDGGVYGILHNGAGGKTISLSGTILGGQYQEGETSENSIVGEGSLVDVEAIFGTGWYFGTQETIKWAGGDYALMTVSTVLPSGSSFDSYVDETYSATNTTITLVAPEPATMILFGIGGLCLHRMNRAQKKV